MHERRPRHWAAEIVALNSLSERRALLAQVPECYRPMVETHLTIMWAHKKAKCLLSKV